MLHPLIGMDKEEIVQRAEDRHSMSFLSLTRTVAPLLQPTTRNKAYLGPLRKLEKALPVDNLFLDEASIAKTEQLVITPENNMW